MVLETILVLPVLQLPVLFQPRLKIENFALKPCPISVPNCGGMARCTTCFPKPFLGKIVTIRARLQDTRQSIFNGALNNLVMNKRFVIVGALLGTVVTIAVILGSPALGNFDALR